MRPPGFCQHHRTALVDRDRGGVWSHLQVCHRAPTQEGQEGKGEKMQKRSSAVQEQGRIGGGGASPKYGLQTVRKAARKSTPPAAEAR